MVSGSKSKEEITLFKSVGNALEDLVAAQLVVERRQSQVRNGSLE